MKPQESIHAPNLPRGPRAVDAVFIGTPDGMKAMDDGGLCKEPKRLFPPASEPSASTIPPLAPLTRLDNPGPAGWDGFTPMLRRIPLPGLMIVLLGSLSVAWMPTTKWQPVPSALMPEIDAYFASMEEARLNFDVEGVMAHYTPDIKFQMEAPDGTLIHILNEPIVRDGVATPIAFHKKLHKDPRLKLQKKYFQYQPGPTDRQFAIRFKNYLPRPDGTPESVPASDMACVFQRNEKGLQMELQIIRVLRVPFPPGGGASTPVPRTRSTPAQSTMTPMEAMTAPTPDALAGRQSPLEDSSDDTPDKLIEDESSGFKFRIQADATVAKHVMTAGTGSISYHCELDRDGISIVYDIFGTPGGGEGMSPQEISDLMALKPSNMRRSVGEAEEGIQTIAGHPFDVRYYAKPAEKSYNPGRVYRWIGKKHILMISFTCRHPEDMDSTTDKVIAGIHFPEN